MFMQMNLNPLQTRYEIDDLQRRAPGKYNLTESEARRKLAALYRLIDIYGWSDTTNNHISYQIPGTEDFLINPYGMMYHEITASSLIKLDINGTIIDRGSTRLGFNDTGYNLHSAVHTGRPDMRCVIHGHVPQVIAISNLKEGYVGMTQQGVSFDAIPVHDFQGTFTREEEKQVIVKALGKHKAMLLRNHGFVVGGETVHEAFVRTAYFMENILVQNQLISADYKRVCLPSFDSAKHAFDHVVRGEYSGHAGVGQDANMTGDFNWEIGALTWEAMMRCLDDLGLKTGHVPRMKLWIDE